MTNNKKIENEQVEETIQEVVEPIADLTLEVSEKYEQCEWVFQFDNDTPQIFAWTNDSDVDEDPTVTITIGNRKDAYITFTNKENGKTLKIFARELTDDGIKLRELQTKNTKVEENESENKEA
jgi:hypothetical protein